MFKRKNTFNLSWLSDEQIALMMESTEDIDDETGSESSGDFYSDGDSDDPNNVCSVGDFSIEDFQKFNETVNKDVKISNSSDLTECKSPQPSTSFGMKLAVSPPSSAAVVPEYVSSNVRTRKRLRDVEENENRNDPINEMKNDSPESIVWRKKNLQLHKNEILVPGQTEMPDEIKNLKTPYDCYRYFLPDEFLEFLADQMNLYAHQKNIQPKFITNGEEVRKFIGIIIIMSVFRHPNVRSYWGKHSVKTVKETLTVNRFEEISHYLHFNDNSAATTTDSSGYDKMFKVRPLMEHFKKRFGSVPGLQPLCVDEQMCPPKMVGNPSRQYMPNKPHNGLLGRYHIWMKTRKWSNRIFYHLLDVALVNSYILYHRLHEGANKIQLPDFRMEVAEAMCSIGSCQKRKVGRQSQSGSINLT